ncbi:ArsR/SmtB family transcription factor [Hyphococcus sp.]|uniref:ArsR/SmtB family transcription factor n=1 Tax=Hyphococcus sp. TaxID=2038636 RepID=UPI0035C777D6
MTKPVAIKELKENADDVSALLKTMSHSNRLLIACALTAGEKNVSEIEDEIKVPQPHLSRELGRLRDAGLVTARRASKNVYYKLSDQRLSNLIAALCDAFGSKTQQSRKGDRS